MEMCFEHNFENQLDSTIRCELEEQSVSEESHT